MTTPQPVGAVTADDLEHALRYTLDVLRPAAARAADWERPAGDLEWSCWKTVEHLADDLFAYGLQLTPRAPGLDEDDLKPSGYLPVSELTVERRHGPAALLQVLDACGGLLLGMVRTAAPSLRVRHFWQVCDPGAFAAMGVVETLVHGYDIASGLVLPWDPPGEVCARVLARLFPDAPTGSAPWPTLLWCAGRAPLGELARQDKWRWDTRVPGERA